MQQQEIEIKDLAIGMNSTVNIQQDLHIVMLDYDIKQLEKVIESVYEIQDFYNLSDAFIYSTRKGFHVFFWYDHVPYGRLKQIIEFAKYVDPMFKYISRFYDHKTIRVAGKYKRKDIQFEMRIQSEREPNEVEFNVGELKRNEHRMLSGVKGEK